MSICPSFSSVTTIVTLGFRRKIDWHLMPMMCRESYTLVTLATVHGLTWRSTSDVPVRNIPTQQLSASLTPSSMTFADKTTLGQSAVLGILSVDPVCHFERSAILTQPATSFRPDAKLTQSQFNWLGSVFYLSYLVFEVSLRSCNSCIPLLS